MQIKKETIRSLWVIAWQRPTLAERKSATIDAKEDLPDYEGKRSHLKVSLFNLLKLVILMQVHKHLRTYYSSASNAFKALLVFQNLVVLT